MEYIMLHALIKINVAAAEVLGGFSNDFTTLLASLTL